MPKLKNPKNKRTKRNAKRKNSSQKRKVNVERAYPRYGLERALEVVSVIKENNNGNPWPPAEIAKSLELGPKGNTFFYVTAASRSYGLTEGGRDAVQIEFTGLGRKLAFAPSEQERQKLLLEAFNKVDVFARVLNYYGGSDLPAIEYLSNTLFDKFDIPKEVHDEFVMIYRENCKYLGIGSNFRAPSSSSNQDAELDRVSGRVVTLAETDTNASTCFVILPFTEKNSEYPKGFYEEVLNSLIVPAGKKAGFRMTTAKRDGSDIIHATILNDLLDADLVLADLTGHNPNVLFELGLRIAAELPVTLIRAEGTERIFDVDNTMRIAEYSPKLWTSTISKDLLKIQSHIEGSWAGKDSAETYMSIFRRVKSG